MTWIIISLAGTFIGGFLLGHIKGLFMHKLEEETEAKCAECEILKRTKAMCKLAKENDIVF